METSDHWDTHWEDWETVYVCVRDVSPPCPSHYRVCVGLIGNGVLLVRED